MGTYTKDAKMSQPYLPFPDLEFELTGKQFVRISFVAKFEKQVQLDVDNSSWGVGFGSPTETKARSYSKNLGVISLSESRFVIDEFKRVSVKTYCNEEFAMQFADKDEEYVTSYIFEDSVKLLEIAVK